MNILSDVFALLCSSGPPSKDDTLPPLLGTAAGFGENVQLRAFDSGPGDAAWAEMLTSIRSRPGGLRVALVSVREGQLCLLPPQIVCELDPFTPRREAEALFERHGLSPMMRFPFAENLWLVQDRDGDPRRTLIQVAGLLASGALHAHPDWMLPAGGDVPDAPPLVEPGPGPSVDPLSDHWHHVVLETEGAWRLTRGRPDVRVGVIDGTFDVNHPDLAGQVAEGFLVDYDGSVSPGPLDALPIDDHGTAVAGMVAALPTASEPVGVAPECRLVLIRLLVMERLSMAYFAASNGGPTSSTPVLGRREANGS